VSQRGQTPATLPDRHAYSPAAGRIAAAPATDADYEDPWQASRVLVLWFGLMLDETGGDLDMAIRAYHRGSPLARLGEGEEYLSIVHTRRARYMRGESTSPTWHWLRAQTETLDAATP
jgi:hypothetical protein